MSMIVPDRLPGIEDLTGDEIESVRDFLTEELMGLSLEDEDGCLVAVGAMAIGAESIARAIASQRVGVDPDSPAFLSESIIAQLNSKGMTDPLILDIDELWADVPQVDVEVIADLTRRATDIARELVYMEAVA